ncbi:hypothetical protein BGZ54_003314 [Gamsiella multidivaricata]|nr:hypothetical protein BGZ54_003314 [Gamsiella multidivaricata]
MRRSPEEMAMNSWCLLFGAVPVMIVNSPYLRMEVEAASKRHDQEENESADAPAVETWMHGISGDNGEIEMKQREMKGAEETL